MTKEQKYRVAHVCLAEGTAVIRQADEHAVRRCLGGRGMGMHLLEGAADEKPLIFVTGPLTDFAVPPGGRYCAVTRSADTGVPISLSSGSAWGLQLKRAGLDGIVIEGQAPQWTYLCIESGTVTFHSAQGCVGMRSGETTVALQAAHGAGSPVLSIGPAGENLVPMAAILCNTERAFSRGGIGRTMGEKKLKAIVVRAGNDGDVPVNACSRCAVRCRNGQKKENPGSRQDGEAELAGLCNEYGLDAVGTARVIAAAEALCRRGAADLQPAGSEEWVRRISCPQTRFERLAGEGAGALQRAFGDGLLPPPEKAARERLRQNLSEEMAAAVDSMGCCLFTASAFSAEKYAELLKEATGEIFSAEDIARCGAGILRLEQKLRQGSAR